MTDQLSTMDIAIIVFVSVIFISMIAAGVAATLCNNRPRCFGTKYDDFERELMGCEQCGNRAECLGE